MKIIKSFFKKIKLNRRVLKVIILCTILFIGLTNGTIFLILLIFNSFNYKSIFGLIMSKQFLYFMVFSNIFYFFLILIIILMFNSNYEKSEKNQVFTSKAFYKKP